MKLFGTAWCPTTGDLAYKECDAKSKCFGRIIMGSKYVDDLEAWVKAKAIKKPDANLAAFLAVRELVKARLDDGYSATIIHEFLRAGQHIDICYDTFLKYVHRYVQPPRKGPKAKGRTARTVGHGLSAGTASTGKRDTSSGILGFTFNSNPKPEDLI
jgi:hypothetical protein